MVSKFLITYLVRGSDGLQHIVGGVDTVGAPWQLGVEDVCRVSRMGRHGFVVQTSSEACASVLAFAHPSGRLQLRTEGGFEPDPLLSLPTSAS